MLSKAGANRGLRRCVIVVCGNRKSECVDTFQPGCYGLRACGLRGSGLRSAQSAVRRPQSAGMETSIALLTGKYRGKRVSFQRHLYSTPYLTCRPTPHLYPLPLRFTQIKMVGYPTLLRPTCGLLAGKILVAK
jgi:hypothetical protein